MNYKKLAGAAIAALVGLGMLGAVAPAIAATGDPTITITGPSVAGRSFSSVRIATYDHVTYDDADSPKEVKGFDLVTVDNTAFKTALIGQIKTIHGNTNPMPAFGSTTIDDLDPMQWVAQKWLATQADDEGADDAADDWGNKYANNEKLRQLANWLETQTSKFSTEEEDGWNFDEHTFAEAKADGEGQVATLETKEGLHFVWDTTIPDLEDPVPAPGTNPLAMIVGTEFLVDLDEDDNDPPALLHLNDRELGVINVKGDLVTIDKDIVEACTLTNVNPCGTVMDENNELEDVYTAATGQVLEFIIRTNVPSYPSSTFNTAVFEITDTWSAGLDTPIANEPYNAPRPDNSLVVTAGPEMTLLDENDFTFISTPASEPEPGSFTLTLNPAGIKKAAGKSLMIAYKAKVLAGGKLDDRGTDTFTHDTNSAVVEFTSNWDKVTGESSSKGNTAKDEVDIYTYPFEIVKRDLLDRSLLTGATFEVTGPFADGSGVVSDATRTMSTDGSGDGQYILTGLQGNAVYQVTETTVPSGYTDANKDVARFLFWIEVPEENLIEDQDEPTAGVPKYHFATYNTDITTVTQWNTDTELIDFPWVNPAEILDNNGTGSADNHVVDVFNAKSASDMPSTGGQILLIAGIAGALGLGAVTFGALGLRKRKAAAVKAA